jgi:hypothetical protein
MGSDTRITVTIRFHDVAWAKVLDVLIARFKLDFFTADSQLRRFFKSFHLLLNLRWFRSHKLDPLDNTIAVALCEVYSADTVVLEHHRPLQLGSLKCSYRLLLSLSPRLSRDESKEDGRQSGRIELSGFGKTLALTSFGQICGAHTILFVTGLLSYIVLSFMLLYGVSVLWQLHLSPAETIIAGTRRLDIGIALLATLVGIAGIFGRAIANVFQLLRRCCWPSRAAVGR